ncbi:CBR-RPA-2 protein [Ditylenchus destructor]|uniref:CBR-RPA-2 protein n=1 Tax=Ditylenchus destructor TaxID=166010 RepID=A0AAD4MNG6_9BILA|nr:CBR-RPA-2 protein [Ditylenchus destructor]
MPFDKSRYKPQVWGKPIPGSISGNADLFDRPGTSSATAARHHLHNPEAESMDPNASYDQFAGGWGDEEENYMEGGPSIKGRPSTGAPIMAERASMFDKIPLPVTISNLCQIEEDRDKYKIDDYSFGTVRTVARVMRVTELPGTITYQCCDMCEVELDKVGVEDMFPIIRYFGVDDVTKREVFEVGTTVMAMGKLRTFSSKASIVSFHVIKVESPEEIALFQRDAELAALYYRKKLPELTAQQLIDTGISMFSPLAPERKPFNAGDAAQRAVAGHTGAMRTTTPSRTTPKAMPARGFQQPNTPASANRAGPGRPMFNTQSASKKVAGLNAQQQKIYECIRECANSSEGVSLDQIKRTCRITGDCLNDLNHLRPKKSRTQLISGEKKKIPPARKRT